MAYAYLEARTDAFKTRYMCVWIHYNAACHLIARASICNTDARSDPAYLQRCQRMIMTTATAPAATADNRSRKSPSRKHLQQKGAHLSYKSLLRYITSTNDISWIIRALHDINTRGRNQ